MNTTAEQIQVQVALPILRTQITQKVTVTAKQSRELQKYIREVNSRLTEEALPLKLVHVSTRLLARNEPEYTYFLTV